MEDDLQWKTTSIGRRPPMEDDLQWKTTSNGRQPENIQSGIDQQPLIGSYQPPIEDDLEKSKVECINISWIILKF
jgi:hypothetical protein